jgi:acyl-CoA thioesterase-1
MLRLMLSVAIVAAVIAPASRQAEAQPIAIVALGASNTYGKGRGQHPGGVEPARAYPAQLQAMLKAKGYDVRVVNAGVAGDTTSGMLARLNAAVPNGTQIVILQPGGNDARRGVGAGQRDANIAEIRRRLQARGIKVILLERIRALTPPTSRHPDGQHFDAQGHAAVAAHLLPQVIAAIGTR